MRRLLAYAALPVFALMSLPALAESFEGDYLPPPGPASYSDTLRQVSQLPAFRAQLMEDEEYRNRARAMEVAAPVAAPQIQPVRNYQVAAIPDYLPMNRVDAQRAPVAMPASNIYGSAAYAAYSGADTATSYQQAGFIQQPGTPNAPAGSSAAANAASANASYGNSGYGSQASAYGNNTSNYGSSAYGSANYGASANAAPAATAPGSQYGNAQYGNAQYGNTQQQAANQYDNAQYGNSQYGSAQPSSPLLAQEPAYAVPVPSPAYVGPGPIVPAPAYPVAPAAPAYVAPVPVAPVPEAYAYAAPQAVPAYPAQPYVAAQNYAAPAPVAEMAPAPVQAPIMAAPQVSMPYNPPIMQGNPVYEYVDAPKPREPDVLPGRQGFFVTLRSGMVFGDDTSFDTAGGATTYQNSYHTGWNLTGGAGYAFRPFNRYLAPRVEAEFGTIRQSVDKQTVGTFEFKDPDAYGNTDTLAGIFSGYFDLMPYNRWFVPYLGGGIGFAITDFDRHGVASPVMADSGFGFAWQAAAGVGIQVSRSSMLDIGYRYFQAPSVSLEARDGTTSETDMGAHMIMVGYRQGF